MVKSQIPMTGATPEAEVARVARLLTKQELAPQISLGVRTIENEMAIGMPHLRLSYRCVRFNLDEVVAWLERKYRIVRRGPVGRFGGRDSVASMLPEPESPKRRTRRKPLQQRVSRASPQTV